jgi:hypothetical protein
LADGTGEVLWSSDRSFQLWSYGAGHSQLALRTTEWSEDSDVIRILFSGVQRVETVTYYRGPLVLRSVDRQGPYAEAVRTPRLRVEIQGAEQHGFVAASGVRITRETQDGAELELLFWAPQEEQ